MATTKGLVPGTYADVVTNDLVLRSRPGVSAESEIFPDELNAPMSVSIVDGPVEADGYRWFLVVAFDEAGSVPALVGWVAAEGKDGEVWLRPVDHTGGDWSIVATDDAPPDLEPRSGAQGPDGNVYFFGGSNAEEHNAWALDSHTGAWRELAPMPTPRIRPSVAATEDGLFYVIGGDQDEDRSVVEVYDAETNAWTDAADAPPGDPVISIAGSDGIIWLINSRGHLLRYDPAVSDWAFVSQAYGSFWDAASGAGTEAHLLGYEGSLMPFDVASGAFGEQIDHPGITRFGAASAIGPDGRIYLLGGLLYPVGATCSGWRMSHAGLEAASLVEAFDPATGDWATIAPLPAGLAEPAAFTTEEGILVVGRRSDPNAATQGMFVPRTGGIVVARLTLPRVTASVPLTYADQEVSSTGCGPA